MTPCAILLISAAAAVQDYQGVLLDFSATWCGPCQQVRPTVERLERQGFPIRKVDIDKQPQLARRYGINAVPTFVLVIHGKEVRRISGPISESTMRKLIARIPVAKPSQVASNDGDAPQSLYQPPKKSPPERKRFQLPLHAGQEKAGTVIRANNDEKDTLAKGTVALDPMAASVRIRVQEANGINYGSGTVIDSRAGKSLVLTCGHIFRGLSKSALVEVDFFSGGAFHKQPAKVIDYDLKADVGLVSIATPEPVPVAPPAPISHRLKRGDALTGIGCGGGQPPSKLAVRVTGVNVYLGPGNLECTGMPKQGRSGGGLFNSSGRLVGVCFAAEPRNRRGLYASLKPIHVLLRKAGVEIRDSRIESDSTQLAEHTGDRNGSFADAAVDTNEDAPGTEAVRIDQRQLALMQIPRRKAPGSGGAESSERTPNPFPATRSEDGGRTDGSASGDETRSTGNRRLQPVDGVFGKAGTAEVICIIRRLDDPKAPSKVVIINRASPKFVRYLQNETASQPRKTAKFVNWAEELRVAGRVTTAQHETPRQVEETVSPFRTVGHESSRPATAEPQPGRYRRSRATR